jgi:hypothetical protein
MKVLKLRKKSNAYSDFQQNLLRANSESDPTRFPPNILVVGAGDEAGTYILVVVVA